MKTKGIYTHTRCRRKHRLFCKFESCKGNKYKKPPLQKNSGGYLELKDKLLTLVSKAVAKLLVFSELAKLISNF